VTGKKNKNKKKTKQTK